jgi:hypothetical protein
VLSTSLPKIFDGVSISLPHAVIRGTVTFLSPSHLGIRLFQSLSPTRCQVSGLRIVSLSPVQRCRVEVSVTVLSFPRVTKARRKAENQAGGGGGRGRVSYLVSRRSSLASAMVGTGCARIVYFVRRWRGGGRVGGDAWVENPPYGGGGLSVLRRAGRSGRNTTPGTARFVHDAPVALLADKAGNETRVEMGGCGGHPRRLRRGRRICCG